MTRTIAYPFFSSPSLRSRFALVFTSRHRAGRHAKQSAFTGGTLLVGCGIALAVTTGALTVGGASSSAATASVAPVVKHNHVTTSITGASTHVPLVVNDGKPVIASLPTVSSGSIVGGTTLTLAGDNLTAVSSATVGGQPATVAAVTKDAVTIAVPASADYTEGAAPIDLYDTTGAAVPVDLTPATTPAGLVVTQNAPAPALTFTYTPDPGIEAQEAYVLAHWASYNPDYTVLDGMDCANFASQGLVARGWAMDADWWYSGGATSSAWISSTALRGYLAAHPERATLLSDAQRDQVKVGDIAQFDWDDSGDEDHTATVTRVEHTASGTRVWTAGHTKDADYWDVDEALASGGGTVVYWSIH